MHAQRRSPHEATTMTRTTTFALAAASIALGGCFGGTVYVKRDDGVTVSTDRDFGIRGERKVVHPLAIDRAIQLRGLKIPPPNGYVEGCSLSILEHGFCRIQWPEVGGMAYVVVNGEVLTVQAHDPGSFFGPMPKREYTLKGVGGALSCLGPDGQEIASADRFAHCAPMLNAELAKIAPL
jgi:hypothetical protein